MNTYMSKKDGKIFLKRP